MRTHAFSFVALTVAALGFISCNKEIAETKNTTGTHTVTIIPEETKTVIDGSGAVHWTGTETVYAYENGNKATTASIGSDGKITATFTDSDDVEFKYYAIVGKSVSGSKNPLLSFEQTATATTYDSDADILISNVSSSYSSAQSQITLKYARPVVINKMTLTGLSSGEKVKEVEFSSASVYLAGRFKPNFENGSISGYGVSDQKKNIVVSYKSGETANGSGTFPVYFITFPTLTNSGVGDFTVKVTTDKYQYTKTVTGKKLEFKLNTFTTFTFGLSDAEKTVVTEPVSCTLVTSTADLSAENAAYIIVAKDADYALGGFAGGNNHPQAAVTKDEDGSTVKVAVPSDVIPLEIKKSGDYYTIRNVSGDNYTDNYLYLPGASNYLKETTTVDDKALWTIAIGGDNKVATIQNKSQNGQYFIRYNDSDLIFSCYKGTQKDVQIYKYNDGKKARNLSFSYDRRTYYRDTKTADKSLPTLNGASGATVVYSSSNPDKVTVDPATGEIMEAKSDGTVTITATVNSDETYRASKANYTLVILPNEPIIYDSLESLVEATVSQPSNKAVTVSFTNKEIRDFGISGNSHNGIFLNAGSRDVEIYLSGVPSEWILGGKVSGTVTGVWKAYIETWEIAPIAGTWNWSELSYTNPAKKLASLEWVGYTNKYSVGATFSIDGTITAKYNIVGESKSLTKNDVTLKTAPDMSKAGTTTATISYTEGDITVEASATITVTSASETTVTYAQTSATAVSVSSGTAPDGSSASFNNTYTSNKQQLTKGNSMTLTLKEYKGKKITGITLSMKSNGTGGSGYLSVMAGTTALASIGSSDSGVAFNNDQWHGSYSTSFVDVDVTINDKTHIIGTNEDVTITIGATVNSLYCQSFTITYE